MRLSITYENTDVYFGGIFSDKIFVFILHLKGPKILI